MNARRALLCALSCLAAACEGPIAVAPPDEPTALASRALEKCIYRGAGPRGVVLVTDFGAAGDGVTDDTAALRCALGWFAPGGPGASNGGGTVQLPAGYYNVADTLEVPRGVRLVGVGSTSAGFCQVRLTRPGRPLFRITNSPGMTDIVLSDFELRYLGPGNENWPIDAAVTLASDTTGVLVTGTLTAGWVQALDFERLHVAGFTRGLDVGASSGRGDDAPMVDSVRVSQVMLEANAIGMRLRSANLSNWNVENVTTTQQPGQVGVVVEAGSADFMQLNCQAFRADVANPRSAPLAGACLEVGDQSGLHVRGLHAEGTRHAVHVTPAASLRPRPIVLEDSFLGEGVLVEGAVRLVSRGNVYAATSYAQPGDGPGVRKLEFTGAGAHSLVTSFGDAFEDPLDGTTGGAFLGVHPQVQADEVGLSAQRVVVATAEGSAPMLEASTTAANPGRELLRLGQGEYHYGFRRSASTGYLDVTGTQTDFWGADWTGLSLNGALQLKRYGAPPNACTEAFGGAVALSERFTLCVCRPGAGWVSAADGVTACGWR